MPSWAPTSLSGTRTAEYSARPIFGQSHLLDQLAELHARHRLSLVVIDPLAAFLPARSENAAACVLEALMPLQRLTAAGLSVLLSHHLRRRKSAPGQAARGSGALSGFADILLEMRWYRRTDPADRRRKLQAFSRGAVLPVLVPGTKGRGHLSFFTRL